MRIREAGDSALLLELAAVIDPKLNAQVVGIARAIGQRRIPGVRDVVPTYRSVAVHFDPLAIDAAALERTMIECATAPACESTGEVVEVPVVYGGEEGPDLADVAAFAGLSEREVIDRHSAAEYRVFMLGFLPGFAYMGLVDKPIAMPRKATPRLKVPAGSVGIAGRQTGVYPRPSPGGWQLIGRTSLETFDPFRTRPCVMAAGDRVRFTRVDRERAGRTSDSRGSRPDRAIDPTGNRLLTIIRPGLFTTVQDLGRWGHQHSGVPVSGPMDAFSHRLANALVGNDADAATLEATILGPEIRFEQRTLVAITGADLGASLDGAAVDMNRPHVCGAGGILRFGQRRHGARTYLACDGGMSVPRVLGSRATHVLSALGGLDGRALIAGDQVPLGSPRETGAHGWSGSSTPGLVTRLRVMQGPQHDDVGNEALETLLGARFMVSPQSDRMGYRLTGSRVGRASGDTISDAAFAGGVQIPPSGEPILLMADHQTTGGYPQIVTVITADLPAAGQLAPGDAVEFVMCTRAQAIEALVEQESALRALD